MKVKIGDKIVITERINECGMFVAGNEGEITSAESATPIKPPQTYSEEMHLPFYNYKRIGGSMSKYQEIKDRIEQIVGWTKEADDTLQEIRKNMSVPYAYCTIKIAWADKQEGLVRIWYGGETSTCNNQFHFDSQCGKNEAFKKALLWLLDQSDIKKDIVGREVKAEIEGKIYKVKVLEGM